MPRSNVTVVPGIDERWLAEVAAVDPVSHAFAVHDLAHERARTRFVTLREGGRPRAYLLIWLGAPGRPVVHWVGDAPGSERLVEELPPRPLVAVVPPSVAELVARRREPTQSFSVLLMESSGVDARPEDDKVPVRALSIEDAPALRQLAEVYPSFLTSEYRRKDPSQTRMWGSFEGGRLVGVARTTVALPAVWVIGGIFTVPSARGRGVGYAVTAAVTRAALASGARAALYVREDNGPARRVYDRLGFRVVGRRVWVDAGVGSEP